MSDTVNTSTTNKTAQVNVNSFEDIYRAYWSDLFLFSYNLLRDRDHAKDVVQEVFISLLRNENREQIQDIRAYLFQAVKFQVYKMVRAEKVKLQAFDQLTVADYDDSTNEQLLEKELRQQMEKSIVNLPDKCRDIFELRQQGYTAKKIASITGVSQRTVEHQIYLAVKKLRVSLSNIISLSLFAINFLTQINS